MRLNYRHLRCFWAVARHGTILRASRELHISRPAITAQIRKLERALGHALFERTGRTLRLTATGRHVYGYAEDIFALGRDLTDSLRPGAAPGVTEFRVGLSDALPKMVAHRMLASLLEQGEPLRLHVVEGRPEPLMAQLATHEVDLVLSDMPMPVGMAVRSFEHVLGECGVTVFAQAALSARLRGDFPESLNGAPWLLPSPGSALRTALDRWFAERQIEPRVVAEIQDSALLKSFGKAGVGLFAAPSAVEKEIREQYRVAPVGRIPEVRERFFAISTERQIRHPAVLAIVNAARSELLRTAGRPPRGSGSSRGGRSGHGFVPASAPP